MSPDGFYLPYCDECEKYKVFVDNKCSNHRSHRTLVTCNYCQNGFKTYHTGKLVQFVVGHLNVN